MCVRVHVCACRCVCLHVCGKLDSAQSGALRMIMCPYKQRETHKGTEGEPGVHLTCRREGRSVEQHTVRQSDKEDNSGCYAHKMSNAAIQRVTI